MAEYENADPPLEKAVPKTYKELADRDLKRVSRLLKKTADDELSNAELVSVILQQANVYATLELAETIRSSARGNGGTT